MWPWEHLAVSYLLYSLVRRGWTGVSPTGNEILALAVGTQFPDLIDKPLAWELGLLPSGTTLMHSLFTALPVSTIAIIVAVRRGMPRLGIAFAVGYLLHLPADAIYPVFYGEGLWLEFLVWPLIPVHQGNIPGFIYELRHLVGRTVRYLSSPAGWLYLSFEVGLLVAALSLWYRDGLPGIGTIRVTIDRVRT